MNAGVALVQSYLQLNGFLTVAEQPVIRGLRGGQYSQLTDLDIVGVRFPGAAIVVPRGRPGPQDDLRLKTDPALGLASEAVEVVIGEVKEGKARLNDSARSHDVLYAALVRVGCVPEHRLEGVVAELQSRGEARTEGDGRWPPCRIRLFAFGEGQAGRRAGFEVMPLRAVAAFVNGVLERYHDVLHPADLADPVLGLLHLLKKLE